MYTSFLTQTAFEKNRTQMDVDNFNQVLKARNNKEISRSMGKEEFLKLLITQLQHQDPTSPMEDREFIAQMAQFSELEQMTNLNKTIGQMQNFSLTNNAFNLLGKNVEIILNENKNNDPDISQVINQVNGKVTAVKLGETEPMITVNNREYFLKDVKEVKLSH